MKILLATTCLLMCSNIFMTFAWYAHLKNMNHRSWFIAALFSWGIAFFEYLIQVPANRLGHTEFSVSRLKILQEVISLSVFIPFSMFYLGEPFRLNYVWAGLCLVGAVFFMFRG